MWIRIFVALKIHVCDSSTKGVSSCLKVTHAFIQRREEKQTEFQNETNKKGGNRGFWRYFVDFSIFIDKRALSGWMHNLKLFQLLCGAFFNLKISFVCSKVCRKLISDIFFYFFFAVDYSWAALDWKAVIERLRWMQLKLNWKHRFNSKALHTHEFHFSQNVLFWIAIHPSIINKEKIFHIIGKDTILLIKILKFENKVLQFEKIRKVQKFYWIFFICFILLF